MHQKKLALGILGLITLIVIYFFLAQFIHTNQTITLQQKLDTQLTQLGTNGFTLSRIDTDKENQHFLIRLSDPEKASSFLTQKGIPMSLEEAKELQGLELGVELTYLRDSFTLELYPVAMPTNLQTILAGENDEKILMQFEELLKKKTLSVHIDVDDSGRVFNGYLKDINETLAGTKEVKLLLQGSHFSGNIKNGTLVEFTHSLQRIHFYIEGLMDRTIYGLKHHYLLTGLTKYDHTQEYSIDKLKISEAPEAALLVNSLYVHSTSHIHKGVASETFRVKIENSDLLFGEKRLGMKHLFLDMHLDNIDIHSFETLQQTGLEHKKALSTFADKIFSNNIHMDIPLLSVEKMRVLNNEVDGFTLHADMDIDSSLSTASLSRTPEEILSRIDATVELSLSKELLALIIEAPEAMLLTMTYRPKNMADKSIYTIHLKDGVMKINDKTLEFHGKPVKF